MADIGYVTLPVIASFSGIDGQVNKAFGPLGKKAGRDFNKGLGDGLKSSEADIKRAGDAYTKLKDKAADALGKIRKEEAALQDLRDKGITSGSRIVAAEERLATARRNSTRAEREASDGHRALETAQAASIASSVAAGGALGKLSTLAAGAGTALLSAGAIAGGAALVGITALAAGVLVAGNRLYDLGAQFDDTFDNIRIKTGATGADLAALQKATEGLSTKVPLSIGQIGNVVAETSRALHLTGPDLDRVAGSIANLGRLTGEDVDVRALGKAFRGFGVDAKDQVPALDGLLRASQKTGVGVNELLATIVKGGAGLRQFGFDFGESAALATQFEEAGLDSDKAMAGLTKGLATLAKDGQTGSDALKDNVTQIKNLVAAGDDAAALDLTNKLFGARGGVQFFEAIKNGALDLDTLAGSLDNTGDTIAAAAQDTDDWSEKWQTLKNTVAVALEPLATATFDTVNENLGELADWTTAHKDEIVDFFVGVGQAAITGIDITLDAIGQLAQGLGQFLEPFGDIQGAMLDFQAFQAEIRGDFDTADELHRQAQEAYGWGEGLDAAGAALRNFDPQALRDKLNGIGDTAKTSSDKIAGLGTALGALPNGKRITIDADTAPAEQTMQNWWAKWKSVIAAAPGAADDTDRPVIHATDRPPSTGPAPSIPSLTDPNRPKFGHAAGGPIIGPGSGTSDSIPALLSNGEHVFTAKDVAAMGGQRGVYAFRNMLHRSGGGSILPMAQIPWPPGKINKTGDRAGNLPNLDSGFNPSQRALPWLLDPDSPIPSGPPAVPLPPTDDDILFPDSQPWWMRKWLEDHPPSSWKNPHRNMLLGAGLGFAGGGEVTSDWYAQVAGSPYRLGGFGGAFDCSGAVSGGVNVAMGRRWNQGPPGGSARMATGSEGQWLASQGFVMGVGPPGSIRVGWVNGGPGGGHTAMTLADGTNFESSSGRGVSLGGAARGATDPLFTQHAYLPPGPQIPGAKGTPGSTSGTAASGSSSTTKSTAGGGLSGGIADMAGQAVKIGVGGLLESIGADGSWLPDIENMGIVKTLEAALGIKVHTKDGTFSAMGFQPSADAGTSGGPFGMAMPEIGSPASGVGLGPAPGPIDQSTNINIHSPQGDPQDIENRTRRALKQTPRLDTHMPVGL